MTAVIIKRPDALTARPPSRMYKCGTAISWHLSEMPQSDYQSRNLFQALVDRMAENFAHPIQKGCYRSDVGMCSIESFTKPIGIKGGQQSPCCTPPRMGVRSDTQFLD